MASFLGIDVSKDAFHASLLTDSREGKKVFPNDTKDFEQLVTWLKNRHANDAHICVEATGVYWEAFASYLHGLGFRVSVVNPVRIKSFAHSELLRTKTDAVDAALIARFSKTQDPELWVPPPPEVRILQALMRHYEHLKTTRVQQSVYEQSSEAAVVKASIREVIATLDSQIAQVEREIRQHFDNHPDLKRKRGSAHVDLELAKPQPVLFCPRLLIWIVSNQPRQSPRMPVYHHGTAVPARLYVANRGCARRATRVFARHATCRQSSRFASTQYCEPSQNAWRRLVSTSA